MKLRTMYIIFQQTGRMSSFCGHYCRFTREYKNTLRTSILSIRTGWRQVINFTLRPSYFRQTQMLPHQTERTEFKMKTSCTNTYNAYQDPVRIITFLAIQNRRATISVHRFVDCNEQHAMNQRLFNGTIHLHQVR